MQPSVLLRAGGDSEPRAGQGEVTAFFLPGGIPFTAVEAMLLSVFLSSPRQWVGVGAASWASGLFSVSPHALVCPRALHTKPARCSHIIFFKINSTSDFFASEIAYASN